MEYNDINALLNSVLNDDEPDVDTEVREEDPRDVPEEAFTGTVIGAVTPEALEAIEAQSITVITSDDPAVFGDPIDEIESLIAQAAGEVEEPEPEPEVAQCATPVTPVQNQSVFAKGAGDDAVPMPVFTTDELMESIDIRNFGTLVTLRTARWHAKIKDKKAAKKQALDDSAVDGTYETSKHLLAGADEKLKRVHKAIDSARTAHYALTLPWSVVAVNETGKRSGARLLPNTLFMEYTTAVANAKQETDTALSEFKVAYPNLITVAQQKMGSAFNQLDYPPAASIAQHFDLQFEFAPIPKGTDFDNLQNQMSDKLADTLNRKTRTMLENAMQDAWLKLYQTVEHVAVTLSNPDKMFHYTLIEKIVDQSTMLKHLNVTGDTRIEEIRQAVEDKLTKHDVKDIRKDDSLRKLLAEEATDIHTRMKEIADETK